MRVSSSVPPGLGAVSLIFYLTRRFTYLSEQEWRERIDEGRILLNSVIATDASRTLSRGDVVAYDLPHFQEPPADLTYQIVYEDDWILGVGKSGNCLVHKAGKSFQSNLIYHLRYCHQPKPYPGIDAVHRLDRETSGVVLFAKGKDIVRKMNKAFGSEGIRKEYFAVVRGVPSERSWTAAMPIGKDERGEGPCKFRVDRERGKIAKTHFETIRALGHNCTLIRACPVTGRTHQIRVHLAACGLRLIGDKVYGTPDEHDSLDTVPGVMSSFPRQALHCALIGFEHPVSKKTTLIEAPIPHDMETLLGAIG